MIKIVNLIVLLIFLGGLTSAKVVKKYHDSPISLLKGDALFYPVSDFVVKAKLEEAQFNTSEKGDSTVISPKTMIGSTSFSKIDGEVRHFQMISEQKLGILSTNNMFYEFELINDGQEIVQRRTFKLADPKKHKCLLIAPPHSNHIVYIPCARIEAKEVDVKVEVLMEGEKVIQNKSVDELISDFELHHAKKLQNFEKKQQNKKQHKKKKHNHKKYRNLEDSSSESTKDSDSSSESEEKPPKIELIEPMSVHFTTEKQHRQIIDMYYFDLDDENAKFARKKEIILEDQETFGAIEIMFAKQGADDRIRMFMTTIPAQNAPPSDLIMIRHFIFDHKGSILDSELLKYDIARIGFTNYKGLELYNNDILVFLAQKKYSDDVHYLNLSIDFAKNQLHITNSFKVMSKVDLNQVFAQRDNKMISITTMKKQILSSVCHIRLTGFKEKCRFYNLSGYKPLTKHNLLYDYFVKDNTLIVVTKDKKEQPSFWLSMGSNKIQQSAFKPLIKKGYPLLIGNRLYVANPDSINLSLAIEPHVFLNTDSGKSQLSIQGTDNSGQKNVDIKYELLRTVRTQIQNIPATFNVEISKKDKIVSVPVNLQGVRGNIKSIELHKIEDNSTSKITGADVYLNFTEIVEFPYKHDFYDIDRNMMVTLDKDMFLQVHGGCNYFERSDEFMCEYKSAVKSFKRKGGIDIHSYLVDDNFILMDIVARKGGSSQLVVAGRYKELYGELTIKHKDVGQTERENSFSNFVRISKNQYGYLFCTDKDCSIYSVDIGASNFVLTPLGIIDQLFVKNSKFCPVKIINHAYHINGFLISSKCKGETHSVIYKFLLQGHVILYENFMLVDKNFEDYRLCSNDLFVFFNKGKNNLEFRRYGFPLLSEDNSIDISNFGINKIHEIHCKFSSVIIIGEQLEDNNSKRKLLVLEKREVGHKETYIDNKASMVRMVGDIDDFDRLTVFRSKKTANDLVFLILEKAGLRKVHALHTLEGPLLKIVTKPDTKSSFSDEYKLVIRGFREKDKADEVHFKVFGKYFDSEFSASSRKNTLELVPNKKYEVSQMVEGIKGHNTGLTVYPYYSDTVSISGPYESSSLKSFEGILPGIKGVAKDKGLVALVVNYYSKRVKSNIEGIPDQLKDKSIKILIFDGDKYLFSHLVKDFYIDSPKGFMFSMVKHTNSKTGIFVTVSINYDSDKQEYFKQIQFGSEGNVISERDGPSESQIDDFKIYEHDDQMYYFVIQREPGVSGSVMVGSSTFSKKKKNKIDIEIVANEEFEMLKSIQTIHFKNEVMLIGIDITGRLMLRVFSLSSGKFLNEKFHGHQKSMNYEFRNLVCRKFVSEKLNEEYIGHCIGSTYSLTQVYFKVSRDLDAQIKTEHFFLPSGYQLIKTGHDFDLSDRFIGAHIENKFVSLEPEKKSESKTFEIGVAVWEIEQLIEGNEQPEMFVPCSSKPYRFLVETVQNSDILVVYQNSKEGSSTFKLNSHSLSQEFGLTIKNEQKFAKKILSVSLFGLQSYLEVDANKIFNTKAALNKIKEEKERKLKAEQEKKRREEEKTKEDSKGDKNGENGKTGDDDDKIPNKKSKNKKSKDQDSVIVPVLFGLIILGMIGYLMYSSTSGQNSSTATKSKKYSSVEDSDAIALDERTTEIDDSNV